MLYKFQMRKIILYLLFSLFLFDFAYAQNQRAIDSLLHLAQTTYSDSIKIQAYRSISWEYESTDNYKGLEFVKKAYTLAVSSGNIPQQAGCLTDFGILNEYFGNPDSSLYYYKQAAALYKKIGDEDGVCVVYINMGSTYRSLGKFSEALQYLFEAIRIGDKLQNKDRIASCMITIGNIYRQKKDFLSALKYNDNAYKIFVELNDSRSQAIALNNNGIVYSELKNSDKALECYLAALKIREQLGLKIEIASTYSTIACEYLEKDDLLKAMEFNKKALKINEELENKRGRAIDLTNIAAVFTKQKKYHDAIVHLLIAKKLAEEIKFTDLTKEIYLAISENYSAVGDYKSSLEFHKKYVELKDVIFNDRENEIIAEVNSKYQSEKKDSEIKLLNKDKEVQAADLKRKTIIIWGVCIGLVLLLVLAFFIYRGYRLKQRANEIIIRQKDEVEKQKEIIEEKQKEITDSIHYAKRIQGALLASDTFLKKNLPDYFVLYKPKDIVSGDFYWAAKTENNELLLATADCTGHGVPGAFMSLLGVNFLNEIVSGKKIVQPDLIFNELRKEIIHALNPEGSETAARDGMDAVLCKFDFVKMKLEYAAANNALWIIRNGELMEFTADKMPIGKYAEENKNFSLQTIQLQKGDLIYTFTDGYSDQFGGEKGKKFKYKPLQKLLLAIQSSSMENQRAQLDKTIEEWRGNYEQVDDILMIGVRV